jgi:hypothetical protein
LISPRKGYCYLKSLGAYAMIGMAVTPRALSHYFWTLSKTREKRQGT